MLEVENISVTLGGVPILREVSLTVEPQRIVTILGANGAGKTTLLRAISGIYPLEQGSIRFDGAAIHGQPAHRIVQSGLSHAPEGRQIFSNMTVRENLQLGAGEQRDWQRELAFVHDIFPILQQRSKQLAGTLSGGEQQMLCIGRALMARPRLLILDEPSLGLAPQFVQQIFRVIETIRQHGVTVVLVEQNARSALRIADDAYVLEHGRIALSGPAQQLMHDAAVQNAYLGVA
ncbi:ATP-binding cassette domain-containing protein [Aquitalea denitrificans]|uniref:ATP-binding cassette domain-containing protein n=1 Tax=Aquitalea denitrificans TaxID=519081 RepID=UPI00135B592C